MFNYEFKHNDADFCHDKTLTLHDCIAEKIEYSDRCLRFCFRDGFWITAMHDDNKSGKTVRTDTAVVDFQIDSIDDIIIQVFTKNIFKKTEVNLLEMPDLIRSINCGNCSIEFVNQYRTHFEQMWQCVIRSKKKPYYRECQLHLPNTEATFRWNNLQPEREW